MLDFRETVQARITGNQYIYNLGVAVLIILVLVVYWPVRNYDFISYDDKLYASENAHVISGFKCENVIWAFTNMETGHWHPLTWLSHMLDNEIFKNNAGGHHWTNLILHLINSLLLLSLLNYLGAYQWKSLLVTALFALHPLNVDSVAWISERKNLLSTALGMLTIFSYSYYLRNFSIYSFIMTLLLYALGLLAKPILVVLPVVMLLLDFWPLNRFRNAGEPSMMVRRIFTLLIEKIPFFILSFLSVVMTITAAKHVGTLASVSSVPLLLRLNNILVSYVVYLRKTFWPLDLSFFYPFPETIALPLLLFSFMFLVVTTFFVVWRGLHYPFLPVGWFFYIINLLPVIGILQVGIQGMADRYAYLPLIGIFIMVVWGVPILLQKLPHRCFVMIISAIIVLGILSFWTCKQVRYWKNSETLYRHALSLSPDNYLAHDLLGKELMKQGNLAGAEHHFQAAIKYAPSFPPPYGHLGLVLDDLGKKDEAMKFFIMNLRLDPADAQIWYRLGKIYFRKGFYPEAERCFREAYHRWPGNTEVNNILALSLAGQGRYEDAIQIYRHELQSRSDQAGLWNNMAMLQLKIGKNQEAAKNFQKAIHLQPDYANAHFYLAVALTRLHQLDEARRHKLYAVKINPDFKKIKGEKMISGNIIELFSGS